MRFEFDTIKYTPFLTLVQSGQAQLGACLMRMALGHVVTTPQKGREKMTYAQVTYYDANNIECGTIYFGVTDEKTAIERFRAEYPEKANKKLTVKLYK